MCTQWGDPLVGRLWQTPPHQTSPGTRFALLFPFLRHLECHVLCSPCLRHAQALTHVRVWLGHFSRFFSVGRHYGIPTDPPRRIMPSICLPSLSPGSSTFPLEHPPARPVDLLLALLRFLGLKTEPPTYLTLKPGHLPFSLSSDALKSQVMPE